VQHAHPSCQLGNPKPGDSRLISPRTGDTQCPPHRLVPAREQEIDTTRSRHTGPRNWRRAITWLISAGIHPKANATTQRVADDLADRMDYSTGHARYCLDEMVARTGISKASIKRHIGYLRELGALAWVQHGTRINIRRRMGLKGYAATATIYAAVIPVAYDHAMGHRIIGVGYGARIVIDQRGQPDIPSQPRKPVDNPPVDDQGSEGLEPPSLTWVEGEGKLKMVGGSNYTSQARQPKPRIPHQSSQINGRRRTATDVQKAGKTVRLVRALVNWTQSVPLRQLEFVLRPWTDQDQDAYQIAADLNGMCMGLRWRPKNPIAFIRARLTADAERVQQIQTEQAAAERWERENPTPGAFQGSASALMDFMAAHQQGLARYQENCRTSGHEDLSDGAAVAWDAEADILAFLNGSPA
jgi:hypothetical protein